MPPTAPTVTAIIITKAITKAITITITKAITIQMLTNDVKEVQAITKAITIINNNTAPTVTKIL